MIYANAKKRNSDYQPGQHVLIKNPDRRKMNSKTTVPFIITTAFMNGTVKIQLSEFVIERFNIRQILPYRI